jgi:hypothetical protein
MLWKSMIALVVFAILPSAACSSYNESSGSTPDSAAAKPPITATPASQCPPATPVSASVPGAPPLPADAKSTTTPSGLQYVDVVQGTGAIAQAGQMATVHYTGWLPNGTKFDSSRDRGQPFSFPLGGGQVIKGWDEGVANMHVGGQRRLIVPPELGYGARGAGGAVPPCATLIFDVELLGVK